MKINKQLFICAVAILVVLSPLCAAETAGTFRTGLLSFSDANDGGYFNSQLIASYRANLAAETDAAASPAEVRPPGFTFQSHPVFTPKNRFHFEGAAFTGSLLSLAALNAADFFSTREALKYPGTAEANPVMSLFVKNTWAFAAVKLATTVYLSYTLRKMRGRNKTTAWVMSLVANAVYSWVVYNNLSVIEKVRAR